MAENDLILAGQTKLAFPVRAADEVGPLILDGFGRLQVSATPVDGTEFSVVSTASTNANLIKNVSTDLFEITVFNPTAALVYLKLYNKATAPTVGTDIPRLTIAVPVNTEKAYTFGFLGKRFALGLGLAITLGPLATDVAAVAVGVQVSGTYQF